MTGFIDQAPAGKPSFPGVLLTDLEVAFRLNVAPDYLTTNRDRLAAMGFPEPVAETGERWDGFEVYRWSRAIAFMDRSVAALPGDALRAAIAEAERKFASVTEAPPQKRPGRRRR